MPLDDLVPPKLNLRDIAKPYKVNYGSINYKDVLAHRLKEVKFMMPILPPAQIRFEIDLISQDERGAILQGKAFVKEDLVAEALLMLAIVNKDDFRAKYIKQG